MTIDGRWTLYGTSRGNELERIGPVIPPNGTVPVVPCDDDALERVQRYIDYCWERNVKPRAFNALDAAGGTR